MAISPLEGPFGVQPASPDARGRREGTENGRPEGKSQRRRRVLHAETIRTDAGDELILSAAARELAQALEAEYDEDMKHGN